jgi:hypothetical protein
MIKILFLAANPKDTDHRRLDEEVRTIKERLRAAEHRDNFQIEQEWAVRVGDIQQHLLMHKPHIVHFSGHGSDVGEIILEDQSGMSKAVSPQSLKRLFRVLKDNIRCVVLNACFSKVQADAIAEVIDSIVGMNTTIGDKAAISFAASFYQALGYGRSIAEAFELGCTQIDMEGLNEQDTPQLVTATGVDAGKIYLIDDSSVNRGSTERTPIAEQISGDPRVIMELFGKLSPRDQLDRLMILLRIPQEHRPAKELSVAERENHILNYQATKQDGLKRLEIELRSLIERQHRP